MSPSKASRFSFKKFVPKSLAGQLIGMLLLALVGAQIFSLIVLHDERRLAFRFAAQQQVLSRTDSVIRLLNKTPVELHPTIVKAASSRRLRFALDSESAVGGDGEEERVNRFLQSRLSDKLDKEVSQVRVAVFEYEGHKDDDDDDDDDHDNKRFRMHNDRQAGERGPDGHWGGRWRDGEKRHFRNRPWNRRGHFIGLTISVKTLAGPWLNVFTLVPPANPAFALPSLASMVVMALALVIIVIFMVRRVTRPLARLSDAAERFGRGEDVDTLPEQGPEDIRQATRNFNRMQERLHRYVKDRTQMMAAVSHDLRTPITSLRLRAEMIEDRETREKIIEALAEMQTLAEATLAFAREEATAENTRAVDLAALIDAVVQDLADMGQDASFAFEDLPPGEKISLPARPVALKRAFRNLIENAVKYGEIAEISLQTSPEEIIVHVDDKGPGIAENMRQKIFEPFVRLEESRNRETGGIGLGLAIARSIVHGHGGNIEISESPNGGARFTVKLPC